MSLRYDLSTANALCGELQQLCETLDIEFASALLEGLGKDGWVKMLSEYEAAFFAYLRATPSQRKRKAAWKGSRMQAALAIGALLHARRAVSYLEIAVALEGMYSNTSREGVAKVAEIAFEREGIPCTLWPFDTHNPFAE